MPISINCLAAAVLSVVAVAPDAYSPYQAIEDAERDRILGRSSSTRS